MKRILLVTETGDAWPSGYVRAGLYAPHFAQGGFDVDYESRRHPGLTRLLEQPPRAARALFSLGGRSALSRFADRIARGREARIHRRAREFDAVYLQKTGSWPLVTSLRRLPGKRLVYDLNDAVWLPRWRGFAEGKIREILGAVDAVTCDNAQTLAFARDYNANAYLVPDPPQIELFDRLRPGVTKPDEPIVLGWIGSPGTAFNLYAIWEALERLFARHPEITLRLVGVGPDASRLPPFEKVRFTTVPRYSQEEMVREVLRMDIGLYPLFDVEDSRTRGVLKAAVYMSGQAAVVCPPIGDCADLIEDGVNGMIARTGGEWEQKLESLLSDAGLRKRIAAAGLETVRRRFSTERCFARLRAAIVGGTPPESDGP